MNDWDLFRYILAIERHGGLSAAARALGVTHATVSRRLDQAEAQLGAKLFDRLPSGLTATAAGAAAAARAAAIETELLALDAALTPDDEGPLSITAPPLALRTHLAADLRDFAEAHPRIALSVLSDNRVFDLHRREADLAIRVTKAPAESLWGRKLTDQRTGFFAAPTFVDQHAEALAGSGDQVPVISFAAWAAPLLGEIIEALPGAYVAARCDDMLAALGLAAAGLGLVRAPLFAGDANGGLKLVETLPLRDYAPVWILAHPDMRRTPKVRKAMQFLGERFAQASATYMGTISMGAESKDGASSPANRGAAIRR